MLSRTFTTVTCPLTFMEFGKCLVLSKEPCECGLYCIGFSSANFLAFAFTHLILSAVFCVTNFKEGNKVVKCKGFSYLEMAMAEIHTTEQIQTALARVQT